MIIRHWCPDCFQYFEEYESKINNSRLSETTLACPSCHALRQEKIKEINGRFPSDEFEGPKGTSFELYRRPYSNGRRIMRKEERQGG